MRTIGAYEAKTHLPRLLDEVEKGERITITKHGRPVAVLVPPGAATAVDAEDLTRRMQEFRRRHSLDGITIRELIDDGRRY
jgi:prevent-host-death family protein